MLPTLLKAFLYTFIFYNNIQAQWVQVNVPFTGGAECLTPSGANLFVAQRGSGVYLSTNDGTSWTTANTGLTGKSLYVNCLGVIGEKLFAGTDGNGLFLSTDIGASWRFVDQGVDYHNGLYIYSFAHNGSIIYTGYESTIVLSTDNGNHWSIHVLPTTTYGKISSIVVCGTKTYLGTVDGVYLSTNNGTNWTNIGLTNNGILSLLVNGSNIYAGTDSKGVFHSTNDGSTWEALDNGLAGKTILSLAAYESSLFVGTYNGVYRLDDSDSNWTPVKSGLTDTLVYSLAVCGTNLFAGTSKGLWKRPLSELVGVAKEENNLQQNYKLSQNFPNPFNPTSVISYSLPTASNVKLIVFNTLGQEVKTLVSEYKNAGNYSINFNASSLPSGIYFYKLEAGQFTQAKKMILIK
jgi:photosystem II stability/assembly factor-like uncharacterized protein